MMHESDLTHLCDFFFMPSHVSFTSFMQHHAKAIFEGIQSKHTDNKLRLG